MILDDRLLIEELLVGLTYGPTTRLATTTYWYYRACRAAVVGAGGHLSGPFTRLDPDLQTKTVSSLLQLRLDIFLPEPRLVVPVMAELAMHYPRLNLLNLEVVAFARVNSAQVWLSNEGSKGVLPSILDEEGIMWSVEEMSS